MKQVSLRIPDSFHSDVVAYADSIGVSLNQLALVALADYLSLRRAANPAHTETVEDDLVSGALPLDVPERPAGPPGSNRRRKSKKKRR